MNQPFPSKIVRFTDLTYLTGSNLEKNFFVPIVSYDTGSQTYVNTKTTISDFSQFLTPSILEPQSFASGSALGQLISSSYNSETVTTAELARFVGTIINALKANNILQ